MARSHLISGKYVILAALFILAFTFNTGFAQYKWEKIYTENGKEFFAKINTKTGTPHRIIDFNENLGNPVNIDEGSIEKISRKFIKKYEKLFKVKVSDLTLEKAFKKNGRWSIGFKQSYKKVPVSKTQFGFTIHVNGNIGLIGCEVFPDIKIDTNPVLTETLH